MTYVIDRVSDCMSTCAPVDGAYKLPPVKGYTGSVYYAIEINSLEELTALIDRERRVIVSRKHHHFDMPHITIYDGYVE